MVTQPQDHLPSSGEPFTFRGSDGKKYTLPLASEGRKRLSGRALRDAALGGESEWLAYLFRTLEAAQPDEAALDAFYDMPQDDMLELLRQWGEHGDGDGASLGE